MSSNVLVTQLKLKYPLILSPMAGPSSVELVSTASQSGALGSVGAAYMGAPEIENFVAKVRGQTFGPIAINLFIPQLEPRISELQILKAIESTQQYRKELGLSPPVLLPPYEEDFDKQFETVLKLRPQVFSFVFGLLKKEYVQAAKKEKIYLIGTATTIDEALALQESGVNAVTLQGIEAGGHRGIFNSASTDSETSLLDLIDQCKLKIEVPMVAAGGIMTSKDVKSVLLRGVQAVQMGTAFLTCKEAGTSEPYRRALLSSLVRKTKTTRAFSGRLARGLENRFMSEMDNSPEALLPFPAQNKFTRDIRNASTKAGSSDFLSLWSGTGQGELWTGSASELISLLFSKDNEAE
jgi:nitronate monooxygenase